MLLCFADSRYRLRVNGAFVASGPGRFVTSAPEYNAHELIPFLHPGANCIQVEVNFFGTSSFQTMPDGAPGFIADGGFGDLDLSTPGEWLAFRCDAWRWDAPKFSFAQGPVEILDSRLAGSDRHVALHCCTGEDAPWGPLRPFTGRRLPFVPQRASVLELAAALLDRERRVGFMTPGPPESPAAPRTSGGENQWVGFATWIWSPRAQEVGISAFWSDVELNGRATALEPQSVRGNHSHLQLQLDAGWNLLCGRVEILSEFWPYCLGIPHDAGLSLHARRDRTCAEPLALSAAGPREGIRLPDANDEQPPVGWRTHDGDPMGITPARLMSWDEPEPGALRKLNPARLDEAGCIEATAATWCFSFAGEFLGHVVADVEAPPGSILDVACDDWQREDGGVALYRSNPFTDSADRYILHGGRQLVEGFHARGGKLIQLTLRAPPGSPPCRLIVHDLWVRSRQSLGPDETRFTCDLPVLNWAWPASMRTLRVSTDDAYSDCPWRERASYIGDVLVALNLNALYSPDLRVAARVLRIFGQAQLPNGQLPCCAPAWLRRPHEDYTLLWLIALQHHMQLSGDTSIATEFWPVVEEIWKSPTWSRHASGLWNADHHHLFIDWGVRLDERTGSANAVLNVLRIAAARACAGMARHAGHDPAPYLDDAETTRRALYQYLWHSGEGRLRAFETADSPALHANIAALAFGVGTEAERASILAYVEPLLRDNFNQGIQKGPHSGHLELYFLFFALPALAEHGRPDLAEQLITDHYGFVMDTGDDTLPESFARLNQAGGSRCHAWSGAAAHYAARYVLGVRPAGGSDPRKLVFDPVVYGIHRASGRIAHADGWIDVSWVKTADGVDATVHAPPGVKVAGKNGAVLTLETASPLA